MSLSRYAAVLIWETMISLVYIDNGTQHEDLELFFFGETRTCDSYFLALDSGLMPEDESSQKVAAVLNSLIRQWIDLSVHATDGQTIYLPFDFSDQCTGCLRCKFSEDTVTVTLGNSYIEGYSHRASDVSSFSRSINDFEPAPVDCPSHTLPRIEFEQILWQIASQVRAA